MEVKPLPPPTAFPGNETRRKPWERVQTGVLDNTHFKPIGRHRAGDDARSKNVPGKLGEDEQRGYDREGKNDFRAKAHSADGLKAVPD